MKEPPEHNWKTFAGSVNRGKLTLHQRVTVSRTVVVEVPDPEVWAIDGEGDDAGPKDRELTEACERYAWEVGQAGATYLDWVRSMYRLVERYVEINGGAGDTFVRDAFCPWIEAAGTCTGVDAQAIWDEVLASHTGK